MSTDCFVTGKDTIYLPAGVKNIPLDHHLFDNDAIILKNMPSEITLQRKDGKGKKLSVNYPDMPYLGIWHRPNTDAPYVCIEPWSSLPSRKGIIEDLEMQDNLIALDTGRIYENTWSIKILG